MNRADPYVGLALAWWKKKAPDRALASFRKAAVVDPVFTQGPDAIRRRASLAYTDKHLKTLLELAARLAQERAQKR